MEASSVLVSDGGVVFLLLLSCFSIHVRFSTFDCNLSLLVCTAQFIPSWLFESAVSCHQHNYMIPGILIFHVVFIRPTKIIFKVREGGKRRPGWKKSNSYTAFLGLIQCRTFVMQYLHILFLEFFPPPRHVGLTVLFRLAVLHGNSVGKSLLQPESRSSTSTAEHKMWNGSQFPRLPPSAHLPEQYTEN